METEKEQGAEKRRVRILVIIQLAVFMIYLIGTASGMWREYRQTLIQNQKEQMLITAKILGSNIGIALQEYENSLDFLCSIERDDSKRDQLYRNFLETQDSFECNIFYEDAEGTAQRWIYE